MNVLVTGGCGYIGSALVGLLDRNDRTDRVVVLDDLSTGSPRTLLSSLTGSVDFVRGDVRDAETVEHAMDGCDVVIHLAAITGAESTHDRREETLSINRDGTETVLETAGKLGVDNVVLASSCNVYGRATGMELDETTDPEPINPYAESKLAAEQLLSTLGNRFGFDRTALRMATNYGAAPGVRFNLVVNRFVFQALTDRALTVYGDGSNWRPFIHVCDAARAYAHAAIHPDEWTHTVYNVGNDTENYRIRDVAALIDEEAGAVDVAYRADEHPGPSYHVSFDRLAETDFTTDWTLREGIQDLIRKFTDIQAQPLLQ
ncbi:NAD-dependent epimerase/dehydratase family protein [Halocatena pleomorpha]|uniref:NAD(P)-dependent oxidoreductase n=1 Tax=Halocatena pleomorpha TaxID=1785090 RepID=A0A3P3RG38_9EURY|nr:NAD(P)-dependent oxidoreductase [Halocatena pleomorpha]RRJ32345.1 NAD(P)-dependent oxidoreductase [Halocatena pleomorpha]